jgi:hypothetical protein
MTLMRRPKRARSTHHGNGAPRLFAIARNFVKHSRTTRFALRLPQCAHFFRRAGTVKVEGDL